MTATIGIQQWSRGWLQDKISSMGEEQREIFTINYLLRNDRKNQRGMFYGTINH